MRSQLVLRSPNHGTGWSDSWALSGSDESVLRDCLGRLNAYLTPAPLERWDPRKLARVVEADDRWRAAMLLFSDELYAQMHYANAPVIQAESAWTVAGAQHLADMLPDELGDLRAGIFERFGRIESQSQ